MSNEMPGCCWSCGWLLGKGHADNCYEQGRADVLAKVKQMREWVNDEIHRNDGGDIDEDEWSDGYTAAVEAVLSELNTHFPKAKE